MMLRRRSEGSGARSTSSRSAVRVARAWAELMRRLGYERYGAQGGDFGSGISMALGAVAPERVVGVHVNFLPTRPVPDADIELSPTDESRLGKVRQLMANRPPFQALQALTPQTIGYALTDSPVGQLVWIAERFAQWTDPRSPISDERMLTNISLYWLTATAASSARLHHDTPRALEGCPVPVGVAVFAHDITQSVRPLAERLYDISHWSEFERGGHFAAMEVPELLPRTSGTSSSPASRATTGSPPARRHCRSRTPGRRPWRGALVSPISSVTS